MSESEFLFEWELTLYSSGHLLNAQHDQCCDLNTTVKLAYDSL